MWSGGCPKANCFFVMKLIYGTFMHYTGSADITLFNPQSDPMKGA